MSVLVMKSRNREIQRIERNVEIDWNEKTSEELLLRDQY